MPNRLRVAWHVLRGRPALYRCQWLQSAGRLDYMSPHAGRGEHLMVECRLRRGDEITAVR